MKTDLDEIRGEASDEDEYDDAKNRALATMRQQLEILQQEVSNNINFI